MDHIPTSLTPGTRFYWLKGRHAHTESRVIDRGPNWVKFVNKTRRQHLKGPFTASTSYVLSCAVIEAGIPTPEAQGR